MAKVIIYSLITLEEIYSYNLPSDVKTASLDYLPPNRRLIVQYDTGTCLSLLKHPTATVVSGADGGCFQLGPGPVVLTLHTNSTCGPGADVAYHDGAARYPESVAITNDGFFFFSVNNEGKGTILCSLSRVSATPCPCCPLLLRCRQDAAARARKRKDCLLYTSDAADDM
eukprot:2226083-Rhodomonas_salina.1